MRARQVGQMMQWYRLKQEGRGRGGRLSQSGLLAMMGQVKEGYKDYSHSTVARWESGAILPTRERLETFGAALKLQRPEIDGLIALAGLEAGQAIAEQAAGADSTPASKVPASAGAANSGAGVDLSQGQPASYRGTVIRYCLSRVAVPGLVIAGLGYSLHSLGLSAPWMFSLYAAAIVCMVMAQGFMKLRRTNDLRDLLLVSIFFILTAPLFQTPLVGTDVYGLYTIDGFAGTPFVYLVALIANLLQAAAAAIVFHLLWRWQYSGGLGSRRAYQRAAWVALPPILLVYICNLCFASVATSYALIIVLPVVAGVFMALLMLRDKEVTIAEWDRRFLLQAAMGVTIALTVLGGMGIAVFYLNPVMVSPSSHTTILYSSAIDFNALGYPESEILGRYLVSSTWSSLTTLVYMTVVMGGSLLVTIYRLGNGGQVRPGEATAPAIAAVPSRRRPRRTRPEIRYRPGWLSGHRILQPVPSGVG